MRLRDLDEFHRWVEREAPSMAAQRVVRHFLAEVSDESWRSPSIPLAELSAQPEYEVRQAALRVEGEHRPVQIWCRHTYAADAVDVIAVTNL